MTIETKYNIGDLLQSKFTFDNDPHPIIYEVQFIDVNTCIAGAQVFYKCRPYYIEYEKDFMGVRKENAKVVSIHHGNKDLPSGGVLFREDELVSAKQTLIDILKPQQ
jgi:hypothetical protein